MALRRYRKPKIKKIKGKRQAEKRAAKLGISAEEMFSQRKEAQTPSEKPQIAPKIVLPKVVPVKFLAQKLGQPTTAVISKLLSSGVSASINESVDFETAQIIADEFGTEAEKEKTQSEISLGAKTKQKIIPRPPVVTVMGHVDHGKTKLLDAIRKTNVMAGEKGGITQHIGAYQAEVKASGRKRKTITFLDTPGHEAFSAMRAQGARVTDIVILVVAADDGVQPQTKEAVSHARAGKVPIIVAINKIDKPEADVEKIKGQLAELDLVPEEWGGKTIMVPISAKQNQKIDELLEMVVLTADLLDLKAPLDSSGRGTVIETKTKLGVGPTATIIVEAGKLKAGDVCVLGENYFKIRFMQDFLGRRLETATPAMPVQLAGLKNQPAVGSRLQAVPDEKTAKEMIAEIRKMGTTRSIKAVSLSQVSHDIKDEKTQVLNLVLKADVAGSLEAILDGLGKISARGAKINTIYSGVGSISESDVNLAATAGAVIVGFNAGVSLPVQKLADQFGIQIKDYDVIYSLIDDVADALAGILKPEIVEKKIGMLEILKIFFSTQDQGIAGGRITAGEVRGHTQAWILRNDEKLGPIKIKSLKIGATEVKEATQNEECGIGYEGPKLKVGDKLEVFERQEIMSEVTRSGESK